MLAKIFKVYDYFFYRIRSFYQDRFPGVIIFSLVQSANLTTLISITLAPFFLMNNVIGRILWIGGIVGFIIYNSIRYYSKKLNYDEIVRLYENETTKQKEKRGVYMIIYFIFSLVLFVFAINLNDIIN